MNKNLVTTGTETRSCNWGNSIMLLIVRNRDLAVHCGDRILGILAQVVVIKSDRCGINLLGSREEIKAILKMLSGILSKCISLRLLTKSAWCTAMRHEILTRLANLHGCETGLLSCLVQLCATILN